LTGVDPVFQVDPLPQLPVAIEMVWVKAELPGARERRRVSEKREQGLRAFAVMRWLREQTRMEYKVVFRVIDTVSKRFLFCKGSSHSFLSGLI
jgi:hypothetical protein